MTGTWFSFAVPDDSRSVTYRPWHRRACPARDAEVIADDHCTCPAAQFSALNEPDYEPGDEPEESEHG
jgi:hypothetical protein